ncbi:Non-specific lipid-transfer protein [Heracleum sosnowskyi]|uniref:Non-specific lipid-transfer protein n=1 Tax=Heracleum sosnowskyi TaxID=360622 RepID=A0AAD8GX13_9APIA|nr:Non-specific lipid-transfer protein [Heracleum sosnowskyi]
MKTIRVSKLVVAVIGMVALMSLTAPHAVEGPTCGQVTSSLGPCICYLKTGGVVPPGCCSGVRSLNGMAKTPMDRKQACTLPQIRCWKRQRCQLWFVSWALWKVWS